MRRSRIVIAILFLLAGLSKLAGARTDLPALAWMAGNWTGIQDGVEMEELWLAPKGNTMLALHHILACR